MSINRVNIIGVGPGSREFLTTEALRLIEESEVVIGGRRHLESFDLEGKEQIPITARLEDIVTYVQLNQNKMITVFASGDPSFYGIARYLRGRVSPERLNIVPGISSVQYLAARAGFDWQKAAFCSVHGHQDNYLAEIRAGRLTIILTGGEWTPQRVGRKLAEAGMGSLELIVGERLSYPDELVKRMTALELAQYEGELKLAIVAVLPSTGAVTAWHPPIGDSEFIRGKVPMTKEEVRTLSLAKLGLKESDTLLDIGAGTGSLSIEAALILKRGRVIAVERNSEGIKLIGENCRKFGVDSITVIEGLAPEALEEIEEVDAVFIGGSGGQLKAICARAAELLPTGGRVVINAVTLETITEAGEALKANGFSPPEIVQVAVNRLEPVGRVTMFRAANPVFIISSEKN